MLDCHKVTVENEDIEDCHRLSKTSKNIIVRFVNQNVCAKTLSEKCSLRKINSSKFAFKSDVTENYTPYNQHLAWLCRELKRARFIYSSWSSNGTIKLKTVNEWQLDIASHNDIEKLCPIFPFSRRTCFAID